MTLRRFATLPATRDRGTQARSRWRWRSRCSCSSSWSCRWRRWSYVAFTEKGTGAPTLVNFLDFARTDLFVRSFWNSVYVSAMTVVWASVLALPLAYLTTRFEFRGAALVQTLGFLPLIMPPFVGAVAMQLLFGRNGTVNLLLDEWFDFKIGVMEGLNGVIFLQAIHYFPFILVNLSAALRNIDRAMEEAAQNLG